MKSLAVCLLLVASAAASAAASDGKPAGEAEFEAAIALEGHGEYLRAKDALLALARGSEADNQFVDDALFEAAVILDERLGQPAEAVTLYEEVAHRFPSSRLEHRASSRAQTLRRSLASGAGPLKEFDAILGSLGDRPLADSRRRMEALLASHPDFALADRALFWLGNGAADAAQWDEARRHLDALITRFPLSEWAPRGQKLRADLELRSGHLSTAKARYTDLAASPDPVLQTAGKEGLRSVARAQRRLWLLAIAVLWLLGFVVAELVALRKLPRTPLPIELYYFCGVAALFAAAAATQHSSIRGATLGLSVGGIILVGLAGARSAAETAASQTPRRWLRALILATTALALAYTCIYLSGLTDLVLETLTAGPER